MRVNITVCGFCLWRCAEPMLAKDPVSCAMADCRNLAFPVIARPTTITVSVQNAFGSRSFSFLSCVLFFLFLLFFSSSYPSSSSSFSSFSSSSSFTPSSSSSSSFSSFHSSSSSNSSFFFYLTPYPLPNPPSPPLRLSPPPPSLLLLLRSHLDIVWVHHLGEIFAYLTGFCCRCCYN